MRCKGERRNGERRNGERWKGPVASRGSIIFSLTKECSTSVHGERLKIMFENGKLSLKHTKIHLKRTVAQDLPLFLSQKVPLWIPNSHPKFFWSLFNNLRSYMNWGLTFLAAWCSGKLDLTAAWCRAGSKTSPLYDAAGSQVSNFSRKLPVALWAGRLDYPLQYAVGSQILLLHHATWSQIWQQGVKSKNFGRLPWPLKEQSCQNHIWGNSASNT